MVLTNVLSKKIQIRGEVVRPVPPPAPVPSSASILPKWNSSLAISKLVPMQTESEGAYFWRWFGRVTYILYFLTKPWSHGIDMGCVNVNTFQTPINEETVVLLLPKEKIISKRPRYIARSIYMSEGTLQHLSTILFILNAILRITHFFFG
jgi:type IV secretory pathway protease TraF